MNHELAILQIFLPFEITTMMMRLCRSHPILAGHMQTAGSFCRLLAVKSLSLRFYIGYHKLGITFSAD